MDDYFLGFFAGASGTGSGLALGGLPLPGTLRMASRADLSYNDSFVIGLTPARNSLNFAVLRLIPSISAISEAVYPSILIVSDYITKELKNIVQKLHISIRLYSNFGKIFEKSSQKTSFCLYLMKLFGYNINMER